MKKAFALSVVLIMPAALSGQAVRRFPDANVTGMIRRGQLDSAERASRAAGAMGRVTVGDILVMRGRLTSADSVYRVAIDARTPGFRSAQAAVAEIAFRRADWATASQFAEAVTGAYNQGPGGWTAADLTAAARGFVVLGSRDPQLFHTAIQTFNRAVGLDSSNVDARILEAGLLLDKYNGPDAKEIYEEVVKIAPDEARAVLGLARVADAGNTGDPTPATRRAITMNPMLAPGYEMLARLQLDAELFDSATANAARAIAIDSTTTSAWATLGSIARIRGDSTAFERARAFVTAPHSGVLPVLFFADVADAVARQRRYADAVTMARAAVAADSTSPAGYGVLAENLLRVGSMTEGRTSLDRAFLLDPFNLWHGNILDLLDKTKTFTTIKTARFEFVAPSDEAVYLVSYLGPLLENAYDNFAERYGYRPPTPVRVEIYGRHADFSVRTLGITGLGAVGVSFGTVLVLDSPKAMPAGTLNYGSTAWHELAHTFTLGLSKFHVPRWISEGLSVLEERRTARGWGTEVSPDFLAVYKGGVMPKASDINEGLVHPKFPEEIGYSYYEASLVLAMVEGEHGIGAIRAMLSGYADGLDTPAVLKKVFNMTPAAFDQHFDGWLRSRFATALAAIDSSDGKHPAKGAYITMLRDGARLIAAGQKDSARTILRKAQQIFPDDGTVDSPAWHLGHLDRDEGNIRAAAAQVHAVTMHSETSADANEVEATLLLELNDSTGAAAALDRQQWIAPYGIPLHVRAAELAEKMKRWDIATRERRAVVNLDPPDRLEARYQLARVLLASGDKAAAKREILQVLEQAPAFEKAQALLLDIQGDLT